MSMIYAGMDKKLANAVTFSIRNQNININFQFPPKLSSDNRKGEWIEGNMPGTEPTIAYKTSGPREMTLEFTYIVDGGDWSVTRVRDQITDLRGYFSKYGLVESGLIVYFKMWRLGGQQPMTCRMKGVNVKHSESIVVPDGDTSYAYPLRSDVTIDLRIWTQGGSKLPTQKIAGLAEAEDPQWY